MAKLICKIQYKDYKYIIHTIKDKCTSWLIKISSYNLAAIRSNGKIKASPLSLLTFPTIRKPSKNNAVAVNALPKV